MTERYVPINKGNYSMDTAEREAEFEARRGYGWEAQYQEYRDKWGVNAKQQIVDEYPLLVDIELASVCNLRCPMCYTVTAEFKRKVNASLMEWELFTRIIDEIGGKVPAIRLSLRGEATLHKRFMDCIRYAKDHGIKEVSTLTHGGRLTPAFFAEAADAGLDWITISIDGIGETYERIRKPIRFNELLSDIKAIKLYKDEHGLRRPVIKVQGIWPAIRENPAAYYDTFAPHTDLVAFNPLIDYLGNDVEIEYLDNFTCPQQYQRLVVGADGLVMKCSNDEENREVVGDLNHQSVHEVWHGEKLTAVRDLHKRERGFMESDVCRHCYLPRKTTEERASIRDREFIVHNYTMREQTVGK